MKISYILWLLIILCFVMLGAFFFKEFCRNKDNELKEILKKDSKKNLNCLFGISKTAFLSTMVSLIIISIIFLSFIETSSQNRQTALINKESLDILANKEKISLKPLIEIDSRLYKNSQLGSPKIYISNSGKVKAVNVAVQIIRRQFDGNEFTGVTWGTGTGGLYLFDEIRTYETKEIVLPDEYVVEPQFNTIEVRIYYDREYDGQTYSYRTFYFYGPENWDFKSWYNIKQAEIMKDKPFANVIEKALSLPPELGDENVRNFIGNELYPF